MPVSRRLQINGSALAFVTTTTCDHLPHLLDPSAATTVTLELGKTAELMRVSVVGYAVMPTHVHALLGFRDITDMPVFMQTFKSITSRLLLNTLPGTPDRLWTRRFDDLIVYSEEQFRIKLNYIHNNPVKAGLAVNPCDWKYSSVRDWLSDEKGLIHIDKDYLWIGLK